MEERFYTVKELIELFKVSESWLMRRIKDKEIPSYKFGRRRLFKKEDVERWIDSQKEAAR